MVARLRRQVAGPDAVLHDQHAVPVEAANDRPARARPEAALGDPGLVLQHLPDGALNVGREVERVQRGDGVERLERRLGAAAARRDRDLLVHRREAELEAERDRVSADEGDGLAARGEVLPLREDLVGPGRDAVNLKLAPLVGQGDQPGTDHQHDGTVDASGVLGQGHAAAHGAGILRRQRLDAEHDGQYQPGPQRSRAHPSILTDARRRQAARRPG